jgi:UrcA family protein
LKTTKGDKTMNPSNTQSKIQPQPHDPCGSVGAKRRPVALTIAKALTVAALVIPFGAPMVASAATVQKISAHASGQSISVSVPVDLLKTDEGATRLYAALERKAENACKKTIPMRLGRSINVKKCTATLMDDFISDLADADMTALHEAAD